MTTSNDLLTVEGSTEDLRQLANGCFQIDYRKPSETDLHVNVFEYEEHNGRCLNEDSEEVEPVPNRSGIIKIDDDFGSDLQPVQNASSDANSSYDPKDFVARRLDAILR